jgi:hypothetical protein
MTIKTHGRMMTNKTIGADQLAVSDYGTDNQALVTDGAGSIRWATVGIGGSVGSSTYVENIFSGDGSKTKFQMTATAALEESLLVFVDGVAQPTSAFTLSSSGAGIGVGGNLDEINISPALVTGQQLRVCHLGINTAIADGSITGAKLSFPPAAGGDLLYHNGTQYDRFPIGTAGQLFATNGAATAPEWILGDTAGDILFYNGTNYEKLGIGIAGQLLATNAGATAPYWLNATTAALPAVGADGNVLTSDGTNWASETPLGGVGGELVSIQLFDLNNFDTAGNGHGAGNSAPGPYILGTGTWTKPAGVQRIEVWVVGGGGSNSSNSQGGSTAGCPGAGGGGVAYSVFDVTNISSATYEIGMGGKSWLIGATTNNSSGPSEFVIDGVTMTANGGSQSTSGSASTGGTATGGNLLNEPGTGNLAGSDSERGINTLAPLKRLGLGAEACAGGGSNGGNAGGIFIKEYSDASAHLVGEKLVSSQLLTSSGTWTRPANITKIEVFVVGGGGNSTSPGSGGTTMGGGGGGTAYSILDVTNLATAVYTVGGATVASTFVGATTLTGTAGASCTSETVFGAGGIPTGGQINYPGSPGGYTSTQYTHSMQGHSWFGGSFGNGAVAGGGNAAVRSGTDGCVYIKEYTDASLVSGGSLVPTGVLNPYAGATAPAGWLLCYGQAISRTTYSTLFTAIGTTYGVGDGSTTFLLPDMRGRVAAGQDDMGGTSADRLTTAGGGLDGDTLGAAGGSQNHTTNWHGNVTSAADEAVVTSLGNLPPTIILNYIIKT